MKVNLPRKQTIGENLLYFLVWSAIFLVPVLNSEMVTELHVDIEDLLQAWRRICPYFILFLIHNSLIAPKLLLERKYVRYLAVDLLAIVVIFTVIDSYERYFSTPVSVDDAEAVIGYRKASFTDLALYWNVLLGFFMTGMNAAIKFMYKSMRDEQAMEALQRQNLQTEMDYLKYQINPHFFMNTLNNIHALIDIDAEMAKKSVIDLSRMMRYVLYDSESQDISLTRDLEFIDNYIRLMRIRYDDDVDIRFSRPADVGRKIVIPPLLLIVFVENAFKHGISYRHPSFVDIDIAVEGDRVRCLIANSRHREPAGVKHGIGLDNARKRLELIYGDDFTLKIDDSKPDRYEVYLSIPVLHD
ncbi:MAG: histidine kinase [Alistipes sp.]|nr:histidine kinase [Alistipes sp.]